MKAISCEHVTKTYRQGFWQKRSKPALQDLSLDVNKGEVLGIVGPNGAGKSTIIKTIMGFIAADSGKVTINGLPATNPKSHGDIGYLPETPCLYKNLTLRDHLLFAGRLADSSFKNLTDRIEEVVEQVGLKEAAHLPIYKYSKGMTQRAALAYALLLHPEILILDEPMSGLDPLGRRLVVNLIEQYNKDGNTILFCSHILSDVERICSRIGIMHSGQMKLVMTPEEIIAYAKHTTENNLTPLETLFMDTVREEPEQ